MKLSRFDHFWRMGCVRLATWAFWAFAWLGLHGCYQRVMFIVVDNPLTDDPPCVLGKTANPNWEVLVLPKEKP